jgi:hypothetical protein
MKVWYKSDGDTTATLWTYGKERRPGESSFETGDVPIADFDDYEISWSASKPKLVKKPDAAATKQVKEIEAAARAKVAEVDALKESKQLGLLTLNGYDFYADADATETIRTTLLMAISDKLADTAPVPTPAPFAGYWLTATVDANGDRVAVPMTVGQLKVLSKALYTRNALLWAGAKQRAAAIVALAKGGANATDISSYDAGKDW